MKRRTIIGIIIVVVISLVGVIITQLFWVDNAFKLKEEQFSSSTRIALKSVVNQLMDSKNVSSFPYINDDRVICFHEPLTMFDIVDSSVLDSLIQKEFSCLKINKDYVYGVFHSEHNKFVMGPFKGYEAELLDTPFVVSLSCLCKSDPYLLGVYFPFQRSMIINKIIIWLILSILFILFLISAFSFSIWSLFRQKKLSQMKSDFVNNMTHEFKTPISTISLASEMLLRPAVNESSEKTIRYAHIIFDENIRLKNQVEQVLNIAVLDKGDFKFRRKELDVHRVLNEVLKGFQLIIKERDGMINRHFDASEHLFFADKLHLTNSFNNLIDNANRYSPGSPEITVSTKNVNGGLLISIKDEGMGISVDNQKHIFKKLFRVPTGNIHNVKGFGLGLYYVKTVVEAHGGTINLKSELNRGSQFEIYFPLNLKDNKTLKNEKE